ncbi:MAG: ABC transporter substrate-binding protein [Holosporales bacterium]|jgi:putative ABC transport system substrate-binding protein|nr:ABC transporter substrate-binding protein [Holosporales bacterium]
MQSKKLIISTITTAIVAIAIFFNFNNQKAPLVAIANYGPHASLEASLAGLKKQLADEGFVENKTVRYEIADVNFDHALIPQMISKLKGQKPKVMVVKSTPIAQFAKGKIRDIPLVYNDITDPIAAELIKDKSRSSGNMTGASDMQDLKALLTFVKSILPYAKTIGLLYATCADNDTALVRMMNEAAEMMGMRVLSIPVDQTRDIPIRMQEFKGKADFIYVGVSGPIQPAIPTVFREAQKMEIPLINAHEQAVRDGLALASFGVDYEAVGRNAGKLVAKLLNGSDIKTIAPIYPRSQDHKGFINRKQAEYYKIKIPENVEITG